MGLLKAKRHEKTFPFLQVRQDLNSHMQLMSRDVGGDRRFWDNIILRRMYSAIQPVSGSAWLQEGP